MTNLPRQTAVAEAVPHIPEADSFQFRGALDNIKQAALGHLWVVFGTTVLTTALVAAYVYIWPPTFQTQVMVAADSDKDVQRTAFYQGWNVFRKDGLIDEATLMTSPPVLREVAERLNLRYDDVYHPFTNYAIHLWTTSWVGRNYRAFKDWLFGTPKSPYTLTPEQIERYKLMADFEAGVSVQQVGEASIGLLVVKASNQRAAEIANAIVDVYLEQRRQRFVTEAQQAYASLAQEAEKTAQELAALDKEVRQFRAESGAVLLFEKDRVQIGQWYILKNSITELQAQISDHESMIKVIDEQLAQEGQRLSSDRVFRDDAMKDRLGKLEAALAAARQTFRPDAPEVKDIEVEIDKAQAQLSQSRQPVIVRDSPRVRDSWETLRAKRMALESTLAGARAALQAKTAEYERVRGLLQQIPEKLQSNQEFERRQRFLEAKYAGLNDKLMMASVSMATARSAPPAMRVVERASVPEQPVWPKTKLFLLSAVAGGFLVGVLAAMLLAMMKAPVNRWRLGSQSSGLDLLAVVDSDPEFVRRLYGRRRAAP